MSWLMSGGHEERDLEAVMLGQGASDDGSRCPADDLPEERHEADGGRGHLGHAFGRHERHHQRGHGLPAVRQEQYAGQNPGLLVERADQERQR